MATRSITIKINGETKDFTVSLDKAGRSLKDLEDAAESTGRGFGGISDKVKEFAANASAVFAGGALLSGAQALGGRLAESFSQALDVDKATDKLAAQLGATGPMAAELGAIAGQLYTSAYGDSITDAHDALRAVWQQGMGSLFQEDESTEAIKAITASVMDLSSAFDQDLTPTVTAASQMVRTGLAVNAGEAMDILTRGFQQGADKAGDLLDVVNEYGTQFRDLGLSGTQAMGLLSQGLQAGARDADIVADALKEFAIRAKDGSKTSTEAFTAIGLSADEMAQTFARGGPQAAEALDTVLDRVRAIEDPVKRSQTAIALFGTQAEDLQQSLFALDPSSAAAALGDVAGAAGRMGDTLRDNAGTRLEEFRRTMEMTVVNFLGGQVLPTLERFSNAVKPAFETAASAAGYFVDVFNGEATSVPDNIRSIAEPLAAFAGTARELSDEYLPRLQEAFGTVGDKLRQFADWAKSNENVLITLAGLLGGAVLVAVGALASAFASMAVSVVAATWPFLAIGAAVFGLVSGFRWAYENVEVFRTGVDTVVQWLQTNVPPVFEAVRAAVGGAFEWVAGTAVPAIQSAFGSFMGFLQGTLLPAVQAVWNHVAGTVEAAVNIIRPVIDFLVGVFQENFGHIQAIAMAVWSQISNIISNAWQIISNVFQLGLNLITGNWGAAWDNVKNVLSAAVDMVKSTISNGFTIVRESLQGFVHFVGSIAGRIGEGLINAGRSLIEGLWNGFKERVGWVKDQISGALGGIRDLFPFSPAKEGPFSGRGYTTFSGQAMMADFAAGIAAKSAEVRLATSQAVEAAREPLADRVSAPRERGLVGGFAPLHGAKAGGDTTTVINLHGFAVGNEEDLGRRVNQALLAARRKGVRVLNLD